MAERLTWDEQGDRLYETGISEVALFPMNDDGTYADGVAWNGVTAVNEQPEGGEPSDLYADNQKYLSLLSAEELKATIEAYMSPEEFDECDGTLSPADVAGMNVSQQNRKGFALVYKTIIGNDIKGNNYGYKLNFLYNCKASVSEKQHTTINESPEASTLSWSITTTKIPVPKLGTTEFKPTSLIKVDSTQFTESTAQANFKALEDYVYGSTTAAAAMPTPLQIYNLLKTGKASGQ